MRARLGSHEYSFSSYSADLCRRRGFCLIYAIVEGVIGIRSALAHRSEATFLTRTEATHGPSFSLPPAALYPGSSSGWQLRVKYAASEKWRADPNSPVI